MAVNRIAPWEGRLEWIDNPRTGTSKKGNKWTSVDFVLKYVDEQNNEKFILFNVFGDEKVNTVFSCKPGTKLRVIWKPDAHEYNGRWFGKLEAIDVTVVEEEKKTTLPPSAPAYTPKQTAPAAQESQEAPDADLPF